MRIPPSMPLREFWVKIFAALGSGCGSVGRAVAFNTRGPRLEYSHRHNIYIELFIVNCIEKTKIKKKRPGCLPHIIELVLTIWWAILIVNSFNIRPNLAEKVSNENILYSFDVVYFDILFFLCCRASRSLAFFSIRFNCLIGPARGALNQCDQMLKYKLPQISPNVAKKVARAIFT